MDSPLTISDRQKPARQTKHFTSACLNFPGMDQIDFTGPFAGSNKRKSNPRNSNKSPVCPRSFSPWENSRPKSTR
jgi:hypothetical protein